MEAISPAFRPATILLPRAVRSGRAVMSMRSIKNQDSNRKRIRRKIEVKARAEKIVPTAVRIDYSDPDWKFKYQEDFEARFKIPHISDVLHDSVSYPSTFGLRMRLVAIITSKLRKKISLNRKGVDICCCYFN